MPFKLLRELTEKEKERALYGILVVNPKGVTSKTPGIYSREEDVLSIIKVIQDNTPLEGHSWHPIAFV